jgi:hypothetical protein
MRNEIDVTLGLNGQALAVLHLLARTCEGIIPDWFLAGTRAFYNGRERGFSILITPIGAPAKKGKGRSKRCPTLVVACVEHKTSDSIVVYHWLSNTANILDPPMQDQVPTKTWDEAKFFNYGRCDEVVNCIQQVIEEFVSGYPEPKREGP